MKHSIAHRGSIVWHALSVHYDDDNVQSVKQRTAKWPRRWTSSIEWILMPYLFLILRRIMYFINYVSIFIDFRLD